MTPTSRRDGEASIVCIKNVTSLRDPRGASRVNNEQRVASQQATCRGERRLRESYCEEPKGVAGANVVSTGNRRCLQVLRTRYALRLLRAGGLRANSHGYAATQRFLANCRLFRLLCKRTQTATPSGPRAEHCPTLLPLVFAC